MGLGDRESFMHVPVPPRFDEYVRLNIFILHAFTENLVSNFSATPRGRTSTCVRTYARCLPVYVCICVCVCMHVFMYARTNT